jgi:hypothetical protein
MSANDCSAVAAPDDRAPLAGVGVELAEGVGEVGQHLAVQRIERLRAVEGDERHRAPVFDEDRFITHSGVHS